MSTPDPNAAHHRRWSELPLFTVHQWVASDEDIAAWSEILHLRTLVDQILTNHADVVWPFSEYVRNPARQILAQGLIEFDIDLYLEPWPDIDRAADLLAAWRNETAA